MNNKAFIKNYILFAFGLTAFVIGINYLLDPLSFYRFTTLYQPQYSSNARFQLPGFIKNESYDTLIVGTSMSRNFIESHVNEIMDVNSLNAAIPAATAREQYFTAYLATHTKPVDQIIWEINFYSLARNPYDVEDSQNEFPYHLWDQDPWNDVKYLFSLYPLQRMYEIMEANLKGSTQNRDREMLYKFGFDHKPLTVEKISQLTTVKNLVTKSRYQQDLMMKNVRTNLVQMVKRNPKTKFVFFYPPYGVFWYVRSQRQNDHFIDEITKTKVKIFEELSQYENVTIYDFQDRKEITHVASNYLDIAHYFPRINDWMVESMVKEKPVMTKAEAQQKAYSLKDQVLHYSEQDLRVK